ncbi:MAG: 4Fe-4S ferredoxin, partial [Nitrospirae bacterium]|nr:4Fe-4S ferredoxin [Nitrospirota bacterium]
MSVYFLIVVVLITGIWTVQIYLRRKTDERNLQRLEATKAEGLTEPPSLHPVINPDLCIGSGACV